MENEKFEVSKGKNEVGGSNPGDFHRGEGCYIGEIGFTRLKT